MVTSARHQWPTRGREDDTKAELTSIYIYIVQENTGNARRRRYYMYIVQGVKPKFLLPPCGKLLAPLSL